MSTDAFLVVAFGLGYLLGSIPFGLVLTKLAGTEDLRSIGSGSIGATNVRRSVPFSGTSSRCGSNSGAAKALRPILAS